MFFKLAILGFFLWGQVSEAAAEGVVGEYDGIHAYLQEKPIDSIEANALGGDAAKAWEHWAEMAEDVLEHLQTRMAPDARGARGRGKAPEMEVQRRIAPGARGH